MSSSGVLRLHDQLRAVWKSRDDGEPIVRGFLLLGSGNEKSVAERWFVLLGHSFFYTIHRDSPEHSGALLADIFSPVATLVDEETLENFNSISESTIQVKYTYCRCSARVARTHVHMLISSCVLAMQKIFVLPVLMVTQSTWLNLLPTLI